MGLCWAELKWADLYSFYLLLVHDADFRQSEKDWHSFVEALTERLVEIDDSIPELPIKDLVSLGWKLWGRGGSWRVGVMVLMLCDLGLQDISGCAV